MVPTVLTVTEMGNWTMVAPVINSIQANHPSHHYELYQSPASKLRKYWWASILSKYSLTSHSTCKRSLTRQQPQKNLEICRDATKFPLWMHKRKRFASTLMTYEYQHAQRVTCHTQIICWQIWYFTGTTIVHKQPLLTIWGLILKNHKIILRFS